MVEVGKQMRKIFLDLDDVLFDCTKAILAYRNLPDFYKDQRNYGIRSIHELAKLEWNDVWGNLPESFWADLELLPWANDLVNYCKDISGGNVYFLTSPVRDATCFSGKFLSVHKHWPELSSNLIVCHKKWAILDKDSLLIDDSQNNEKQFIKAGKYSQFYLFPALSNRKFEKRIQFDTSPNLVIDEISRILV